MDYNIDTVNISINENYIGYYKIDLDHFKNCVMHTQHLGINLNNRIYTKGTILNILNSGKLLYDDFDPFIRGHIHIKGPKRISKIRLGK